MREPTAQRIWREVLQPSTLAMLRTSLWRHVQLAGNMRFHRLAQDQVWQWIFAWITADSRDAADLATALQLTTPPG